MKTTEYRISKEKLISRVPGLFAYVDMEDGKLHKATDSEMGCYDKYVENMRINFDFYLPYSEYGDETPLLENGKTYSYRTLIDYYYQYKGTKTVINEIGASFKDYDGITQTWVEGETSKTLYANDSRFIKFMDRGIGIRKVEFEGMEDCTLVPEFIYISAIRQKYVEMKKLEKLCNLYRRETESGVLEFNNKMCCTCDQFDKMGGTKFIEILEDFINESEEIAEEYLGYATYIDKTLSIDLIAPLYGSVSDLGIVSPSIDVWKPYKQYKKHDRVFYNGVVWVCNEDNKGYYDEGKEIVLFPEDKFTLFNTNYLKSNFEGSELNTFIQAKTQEYKDNKITGITDSKLTSLRRMRNYTNDFDEYERPEDRYDWLYYYRKNLVMTMPSTVTNDIGNICKLAIDPDTNEIVITEESATPNEVGGNLKLAAYGDYIQDITYNTENRTITFTYYTDVHLKATNVTPESEEASYDDDGNKLYFWKNFEVDTEGEFKKFGIKYTETHNYEEGGELDKLISGEIYITKIENGTEVQEQVSFEDYVKGKYDKYKGVLTQKFEFYKDNSKSYYTTVIDTKNAVISYFLTEFEADRKNIDELVYNDIKMKYGMPNGKLGWDSNQNKTFNLYDIVRHDYFNGITYMPDKDIDVNITRGNSSVFEKYIRFGEVKTLEDMVEYNNSSFFIMSDNF